MTEHPAAGDDRLNREQPREARGEPSGAARLSVRTSVLGQVLVSSISSTSPAKLSRPIAATPYIARNTAA
jgi:hypothetical protein